MTSGFKNQKDLNPIEQARRRHDHPKTQKANGQIVKNLLRHLDLDLIPDLDEVHDPQRRDIWASKTQAALESLSKLRALGISYCPQATHLHCPDGSWSTALREQIVKSLVNSFDGIIGWVDHILKCEVYLSPKGEPQFDKRRAYLDQAHTLVAISRVSPELHECWRNSTSAVDLVIRMWMATSDDDDDEGFPITDLASPTGCPLVRLMLYFLASELKGGDKILLDHLFMNSGPRAKAFARLTIRRTEFAPFQFKDPKRRSHIFLQHLQPGDFLRHAAENLNVLANLGQDVRFYNAVHEEDCAKRLTTMISAFATSTDYNSPQDLLLIAADLLFLVLRHAEHVTENLRAIMQAGYFKLFTKLVIKLGNDFASRLDPHEQLYRRARACMSLFEMYVPWIRILEGISSDFEGPEMEAVIRQMEEVPKFNEVWFPFLVELGNAFLVKSAWANTMILCENLDVGPF